MFTKIFTSSLLVLVAIGGFFVSFGENNNNLITLGSNTTYADATDTKYGLITATSPLSKNTSPSESEDIKKMYNNLVAGLNIALSIITILVSPAVMLAGWLMSPDWTSGDFFGLRSVMYSLWVTVSNITYFIYAVLLIFIALATIFGRENFGYKAMLPKLALGILLVPFTWWFVQWTISLATIITASVITIPNEALSKVTQGKGWWNEPSIPQKIVIDENTPTLATQMNQNIPCSASTCVSPEKMLSNASGIYGHMLIYAYGVFKLNDVKKLESPTDHLNFIVKLIHDGFISVIMLIVFGLLTLALIFMLLARAVMLWVYTIFSPFMTLELVMGGIMKKVSDDFSIKEFVGLAFVPALVGLALSFGLVMVAAVQSPMRENTSQTCTDLKSGCTLATLMGNDNNKIIRRLEETNDGKYTTINEVIIGGITFVFKGKIGGASDLNKEQESVNKTVSVISSVGGIFGTIVVDIIALLFIWVAFMAAKGVSKVVDAAAKPFQDMGESIGKLGASLPKYTPIPGLGVSAKGASDLVGSVQSKISSNATNKAQESALGQMLGLNKMSSGETKAATANAVTAIDTKGSDAATKFKKAIDSMNTDVKNQKTVTEDMGKIAESLRKAWSEGDKALIGKIASESNINLVELEKLLRKMGSDPIKKDETYKIQQFESLLLNKAATKDGEKSTSSTTTITASTKDKDKGLYNVMIDGKPLEINIKDATVSDEGMKRLLERTPDKSLIKKEFESNLFDGLSSTISDEEAKKMAQKIMDAMKDKFKD